MESQYCNLQPKQCFNGLCIKEEQKVSKEKEVKNDSSKVMTKYERKQAARIAQQKKDEQSAKITKAVTFVVCICVVVAIAYSIANPIIKRQKAVNDIYVKIGEHEVTQLEYDFYYNSAVNNYLTMYSSFLPYMGLDTTKDYADQQYSDTMTWKDAFDEMAVGEITQVKALIDDSKAQGFTYDVTEDYKTFQESLASAAETAGVSVKEYYKEHYGEYATEASVEAFEKETLLASAYYKELMEKYKPGEEEITSYYEANKDDYDVVSYRSFTFSASVSEEATDEEKAAAMAVIRTSAEEMKAKREAGEDFETLCAQYASEDNKATYENAETEQSLTENALKSSIPSYYSDWLFEEGRQEGELNIVVDESGNQCFLVEYVSRAYGEETDSNISDLLAQEDVTEYVNTISEPYEVTDVAGKLTYLTIPEETEDASVSGNEVEATEETVGEEATEATEEAVSEETTESTDETVTE